MFLSNTVGMFLLGVLTGWVIDVNFISAQSFLLSNLSPSQGLSAIIVANFIFSIFLSQIHRHRFKLKFSVFGACCGVLFLILLFGIQLPLIDSESRGIFWLAVSVFGSGMFRWINDDMAMKHLNPGSAKASFFYLASAREVGTVLSFFTLRFWTEGFTPAQMMQVVGGLIVVWIILVLAQFAPRSNLEIQYGLEKPMAPRTLASSNARKFVGFFLLLMLFLGIAHLGQEYLLMLALKNNVGSFEALKGIQADYYLVASLLIVVLGPLVARWIKARRSSPMRLVFLHGAFMLVLLTACWIHPLFISFIVLEVGQSVSRSVVGEPASQMIYASFSDGIRNRLRSWGVFSFESFAGLPLLLLLPTVSALDSPVQVKFWLLLAGISVIAAIFWAWRARRSLVSTLYELFRSEDKQSAILAAEALSYLRPNDFTSKMEAMLEGDPKKILSKTIIVCLAYSREARALDAIVREFHSDKEEIQLAVIEAMKVFRSYRALQFVVDVMSGRAISKSLQVRVNATRLIGSIYGKRAIPFLLRGLEDPDPRIVANTLETLGDFKDRKLIPFFEVFMVHSVPRVRMNALMAVSYFRQTKRLYREGIHKALDSGKPAWMASALFVVGRLKDSYFLPRVEKALESPLAKNRKILGALAWALARLGDKRGYERFVILLSEAQQADEFSTATHFFGQLVPAMRFDVIQYLVKNYGGETSSVNNFAHTLRMSPLDFHRELNYLDLLWQSGHGGRHLVDCVV